MEKSNIIIGIVLLGIAGVIGYLVGSNVKMLPRMLSQPISSAPSVPPVKGFYKGQEVLFIHTEASDKKVSDLLTMMMNSPVIFVPTLAQVPSAAISNVFVFTNGIKGGGPLGFQSDVFDSVPNTENYSPLRILHLVTWEQGRVVRELKSVEEVKEAEAKLEIRATRQDVVINMPIISWPGGKR